MAKAIISTTYSDTYLYFLPITVFCWNKLNVDVICFLPSVFDNPVTAKEVQQITLITEVVKQQNLSLSRHEFSSPKHKEATYAQCLRNYAACLDLSGEELLITSDVDMAVFKLPERIDNGNWFSIFGSDLVPDGQYPQCYISAPAKAWRDAFNLYNKTYQQAIDDLLGEDECEDYRGCRWSVDQEQSYLKISNRPVNLIPRARPNTQFASHRVDRDDQNWRSYVDENLVDAHLWRNGYTDENHANIMELMKMKFPNEDFTWLDNFRKEYLKLL